VNQTEYDAVTNDLMALAKSIEDGKRPGYTIGNADVLANFKRTAERAGVNVGQCWAIFFLKHIDAIVSIMTRPELPQAEEPPGRFSDAINYLRLGFALLSEREQQLSAARAAESRAPSMPQVVQWRDGTGNVGWVNTTTHPSVPSAATGSTGE
jgi:hypothetical protein